MLTNSFFCKTIYSFPKNGTQRKQKTNHYILLTNISIKRCIKTSFETNFLRGGGKSSNQTSTLQTESNPYPSHINPRSHSFYIKDGKKLKLILIQAAAKDTHIRGKYHSTGGLQFDCIGLCRARIYVGICRW